MGDSVPTAGHPRHIVFINQFFWPDHAPTAVLLDQTVRAVASRGHAVTVICSRHGYVADTREDPPPVNIYRVPGLPFSRSPLSRLLSWGSFLVFAAWRLFWLKHVDAVVTMTTPPGLSIFAALLKKRLHASLWIWEMDVYPDVVVATGGLSPTSPLTKLLDRVFTWSRCRADGIIALGECMRQRLIRAGVPAEHVHVAQNWAEDLLIPSLASSSIPNVRILYSGNLGMAHEVETIYGVLRQLADDSRIQFLFAGGGALRNTLEKRCSDAGLANVRFEGYGDNRKFADNLQTCHLGLVTLREGCEGTVVPSKVYSLLSAGRPILFIGPQSATPALLIREFHCGWHFEPGDVANITALLQSLAAQPKKIEEAGMKARKAFEQNFNRTMGTDRILHLLLKPQC